MKRFDISDLTMLSTMLTEVTPYINYGGCCVVASMVAPHLSQHFDTKVRVMGRWLEEDINLNAVRETMTDNNVHEWNKNGVHFAHVVLEINDGNQSYWFDSDKLHVGDGAGMYEQFVLYDGDITADEAAQLSEESRSWNSKFPRDTIPQLQAVVDEFFEAYTYPEQLSLEAI